MSNSAVSEQVHSIPNSPLSPRPFSFLDLKAQFAEIKDEVLAAVHGVLESQHFILGPEVEQLEAEIAKLVNSRFAIACASGSDALLLALMALGIDTDDEIVTTPFTFGATAGAIARLKAKPVFVDIDPATYNLDAKKVEAVITARTRAIMPVHLFGLAADMDEVAEIASRHQLPIVEDAAQSIAARYKGRSVGSLGTLACFSFFPSKNLGGAGDGGLITTDDPELAARLRILRVHGCPTKYKYEILGLNSRLDALQAAILRVKLRHLQSWTNARQRNAERYRQLFTESGLTNHVVLPSQPAGWDHVYNQFVIRVEQRDLLRDYLRRLGIPTEIYYPFPLHTEPAFAYLGYKQGDFPEAEVACRRTLALPIYPELKAHHQAAMVNAIHDFFALQH